MDLLNLLAKKINFTYSVHLAEEGNFGSSVKVCYFMSQLQLGYGLKIFIKKKMKKNNKRTCTCIRNLYKEHYEIITRALRWHSRTSAF